MTDPVLTDWQYARAPEGDYLERHPTSLDPTRPFTVVRDTWDDALTNLGRLPRRTILEYRQDPPDTAVST